MRFPFAIFSRFTFPRKRQHSLHGKRMVRVRCGTVEPVFGSLINYYGLRKINVKGKSGAHKCMLMAAIATRPVFKLTTNFKSRTFILSLYKSGFNIKKLMKFLNRKKRSEVAALAGAASAFFKTTFSHFLSSNMNDLNFSYQ